jgi:hypothetical protein
MKEVVSGSEGPTRAGLPPGHCQPFGSNLLQLLESKVQAEVTARKTEYAIDLK